MTAAIVYLRCWRLPGCMYCVLMRACDVFNIQGPKALRLQRALNAADEGLPMHVHIINDVVEQCFHYRESTRRYIP
jgi:hypothetical protein